MVTLTAWHDRLLPLSLVLGQMRRALRSATGSRAWRRMQDAVGAVGMVRAWEVTFGRNGWHPHVHAILFYRAGQVPAPVALERISDAVWGAWSAAARRCNLVTDRAAFRTQGARSAAAYLVALGDLGEVDAASSARRWGLAREVTAAPSGAKAGRQGGMTPWDLLAASESDPAARRRWREYAKAFQGVRWLVWTRGLREQLRLGPEPTDQVVADGVPVPSEHLVLTLTEPEWQIARRRGLDVLLDAAELGGREAVLGVLYPTGPPVAALPN